MEFSPETIFISYSRADGRAFAEAFEERLKSVGINSWRDLKSIEGGEDIRPQVLRAIERVKHLVLILSRRALASEWVKDEWTHARRIGRKVSPVLADPTIGRSDLPSWIRRTDVYDIAERERWKMLVQVLRGPGETRCVPYPPPDVSYDFVQRPAEYAKLKEAVLSASSEKTVAVTTALHGAGGYGKTTLANMLCGDPDVRFEFTDGILRVEVGKERDDVTGLVNYLIERLDPQARHPAFQDAQIAADRLGELIDKARMLLVIDDVWREAQLRPFLRGGPNCVRLVTTRIPEVLPAAHIPVSIDEMHASEAVSLLSRSLHGADNPQVQGRLAGLADRLGFWAQMLSIANGWISECVGAGEPLSDAIAGFERRLAKSGLTAFDPKDEQERTRAIRACVEASLEDLSDHEVARLSELAVLPEDEDVPFGVVAALWAQTGKVDEDEADDLIKRLQKRSLLQKRDLSNRTLRLHDNMIWYLRDRMKPPAYRTAHAAMVKALHAACNGQWARLPPQHTYGWRFLIRHLREAGQHEDADRVLADYAWIKGKLRAGGPRDLYKSYLPDSTCEDVRLVGRAIALSLAALAANPRELARQMFGRLGGFEREAIGSIVAAAREDLDFRPALCWPSLTPPGAERLRLIGHRGGLSSAIFSPDGSYILTASSDGTARLWDAAIGTEIRALRGHEEALLSAVFSPDGTRILTASSDRARLWDATTGREINTLREHVEKESSPHKIILIASDNGPGRLWDVTTDTEISTLPGYEEDVSSAVFSPDGTRILTASSDCTARLWDTKTGTKISALRGHEASLLSAVFSPDGTRILTASSDCTARLWDTTTGTEIRTLSGHERPLLGALFSPDGTRILTASRDGTARLWDAAIGTEIRALRGHEEALLSAVFSPDGTRILTASKDGTARFWDATTGREISTREITLWEDVVLRGHEVIRAVFSPDGARVLFSGELGAAQLWDAATGAEISTLHGHEGWRTAPVFSPDGTHVLTTGYDATARLWDATTGKEISTLRGHEDAVMAVVFSRDGTQILTASRDGTARLWDTATATKVNVVRGHEGSVKSLVFSPDGTRILTASSDCTARLWDTTTGAEITVRHEKEVNNAVFSTDGTRILTASKDGTARLWDATSGMEVSALLGHEDGVESAVFSPDGSYILTASKDGTARLWDAATATEISALRGHKGGLLSAIFSPDGSRVLTGGSDTTWRLWNATTGAEISTLCGDVERLESVVSRFEARTPIPENLARELGAPVVTQPMPEDLLRVVWSAVFSPDGARVLTAQYDGTARLWDAASGTEISRLRHEATVESAVFSPDGTRILTASKDGTARLWDAPSGMEISALPGHEDGVESAVFSPDGTRILTASKVGAARLWDAMTGTEIRTLREHEGSINHVIFSSDGTRILTTSRDRAVQLWDATTGVQLMWLALDAVDTAVDVRDGLIALGDGLGRVCVFAAQEFLSNNV